jgi:hypothetical protein
MKRTLTGIVVVTIWSLALAITPGFGQGSQGDRADKVRADVQKLGIGADVHITRISGEKLRGQITAMKDDHFSFIGKTSSAPVDFSYGEVSDIKKHHNKIGVGLGILIVSGILLGIVVIAGATTRD